MKYVTISEALNYLNTSKPTYNDIFLEYICRLQDYVIAHEKLDIDNIDIDGYNNEIDKIIRALGV